MRAFALASMLALAPTAAATGTILTFDASRSATGATGYYLTGSGMTQPYQYLLGAGWTVVETNLITAQNLAGADLFVLPSISAGTSLSATELSDLTQWVNAGGSLLFQGDNDFFFAIDTQMAQLAGVTYSGQYDPTGVTVVINAPTHPLIQGPGGVVSSLSGFNVLGKWSNPSPSTTVVASNPDGSGALYACTVGSGRVVLCNDTNYFAYPPAYSADHAALWANTIEWLSGGGGQPPASFCVGDGVVNACPCGNSGAAGRGCGSSVFTSGALLSVNGWPSLASDSFTLTAGDVTGPGLFFQAQTLTAAPVSFGDGLLCGATGIVRLGVAFPAGGVAALPSPSSPTSLHVLGGPFNAGDTLHYQCWYRDAVAFCTSATFNLTQGISQVWGP